MNQGDGGGVEISYRCPPKGHDEEGDGGMGRRERGLQPCSQVRVMMRGKSGDTFPDSAT